MYKLIRELEELANELKWSERADQGIIGKWQGGKERAVIAKDRLLTTRFAELSAKAKLLQGGPVT